jgi:CRP-like cAMP-binding protein
MAASHLKSELRVPKGQIVFRQGDPGDEMFVVESGKIRLTIGAEGHEKEVMVAETGQFFGELSLLANAPRSATARAVEDSLLLAIGRDVFNMMVQDDLGIVYRMMAIQGQRLSRTNLPIERLTQRLGEVRVAAHVLRRLRDAAFPVALDAASLSAEAGLSTEATAAAFGWLAERGVGRLEEMQLVIAEAGQRDRMVDILCELSAL